MNLHDDQIRQRAHGIWEREGRPHGRDEEHWQRAREELSSEAGARGTESVQVASLLGSSSMAVQDNAAAGRKRSAAASRSGAKDETSSRAKKARSKPAEAEASSQQSKPPATSATKPMGNMSSELGGRRGEHSEASPSAKYRHPKNPDLTWSGRRRRPAWIREAVEAGRGLSDFEIGA